MRSSLPASALVKSRMSLTISSRCRPLAVDVADIFIIALVPQRPEAAALHHLGEAEDGVEGRAQFVTS